MHSEKQKLWGLPAGLQLLYTVPSACSGLECWCWPKVYTQTLTTRGLSPTYMSLHIIHPGIPVVHFPFLHLVLIKPSPHAKYPSQSSASYLSEEVVDGEAGGSCFARNWCLLLFLSPVTVPRVIRIKYPKDSKSREQVLFPLCRGTSQGELYS